MNWIQRFLAAIATHKADVSAHHSPPLIIRKTADETVSNSTAYQDDNELRFAIAANEVWEVSFVLRYTSTDVADIKLTVGVPGGGLPRHCAAHLDLAGAVAFTYKGGAAIQSQGTAGGTGLLVIRGIIVNGATPGEVILRWTQAVAEVSDTKVLENSCLIANKLA